jgi:hypothetical protein
VSDAENFEVLFGKRGLGAVKREWGLEIGSIPHLQTPFSSSPMIAV